MKVNGPGRRPRRSLLKPLLLAAGLALATMVWAAPEPKVAVVFDVTNDAQLLVAPAVVDMLADAFARQQNHPIAAVEFYSQKGHRVICNSRRWRDGD